MERHGYKPHGCYNLRKNCISPADLELTFSYGMKHIICAFFCAPEIPVKLTQTMRHVSFFPCFGLDWKFLQTTVKVSKPLVWNAEKKFFELHKNGLYADIEFKMQSNVFLGGFCQIPHIPRRVFKTFNRKKITFFRNLCYEK